MRTRPPTGLLGWVGLLFIVYASTIPLAAQNAMSSSDRIRALRAGSNTALEAGDLTAFMATIDADYVGTAGDGGHIRSRGELQELIAGIVDGPDEVWFVRTPAEVEVAAAAGRAVETGAWRGYVREGGLALETSGGHYTAYWRRVDGKWVIHAELFVTLR